MLQKIGKYTFVNISKNKTSKKQLLMKRKKYYQQELADAEAALMYLRVDLHAFKGNVNSKDHYKMLAEEARLTARIEDLSELLKPKHFCKK